MPKRRKIEKRLADRQAGFNGLAPADDSRNHEGDVTKPGSKSGLKAS